MLRVNLYIFHVYLNKILTVFIVFCQHDLKCKDIFLKIILFCVTIQFYETKRDYDYNVNENYKYLHKSTMHYIMFSNIFSQYFTHRQSMKSVPIRSFFLVFICLCSDCIQEIKTRKKLRIWTLFTQRGLIAFSPGAI